MNWTLSDYANLAQILSIPLAIVLWFFTKERVAMFWAKWWKLIFGVLGIVTLFAFWRLDWLHWLSRPVTLPLWLLILLLVLIAGFGVLLIATSLKNPLLQIGMSHESSPMQRNSTQPAQPSQSDWHNFVSDEIFGVLWKWRYVHNKLDEYSLVGFCPRQDCMNRLDIDFDPQNPNLGANPYGLPETMTCHRCGFKRHFDCDRQTLTRRVFNEIERLVHTGQYVERLKAER
jgi:hypothetical protein